MKYFMRYALASALSISLFSCSKNDNQTCTSGPGGNVEIVAFAIHNGDTIIHSFQQADTAYLSYTNDADLPNPSHYDKIYLGEPGEDHIHLINLSCGTYRVALSVFDSLTAKRCTGNAVVSFTKTSGEVITAITVN